MLLMCFRGPRLKLYDEASMPRIRKVIICIILMIIHMPALLMDEYRIQ